MPSALESSKNDFPPCAARLSVLGADWQSYVGRGGKSDRSFGVDQLLVAAHLIGPRRYPRKGVVTASPACKGCRSVFEATHQRLRAIAQLTVDLAVELAGGQQIGESRGEHHRDRHRCRRDERDASAEAHGSGRPRRIAVRSLIRPSERSPRHARCATAVARRRPRSCGADSPCRRPASSSSSRSHNPRRARR